MDEVGCYDKGASSSVLTKVGRCCSFANREDEATSMIFLPY